MPHYEIPLRPPSPATRRSAHDPSAKIVVDHDPSTGEVTVWPIGCATPLRDLDDFDRYVDALVTACARIHAERKTTVQQTTLAPCKQGCGAEVHVFPGHAKWAECARCAGLESEMHGG
ncbi:hypothetical protein SEA_MOONTOWERMANIA_75 [Gordonia phage MoontowerMania]|nr:hypothetical protein SEA_MOONTOWERMANIA_75 [Gordonia phage MoontowerMania]